MGLFEWGALVLAECEPIAEALDRAHSGTAYRDALRGAVAALQDPGILPSARILKEMEQEHRSSYVDFVLAQSLKHRDTLKNRPLPPAVEERFARLADESLAEQRPHRGGGPAGFRDLPAEVPCPVVGPWSAAGP